jgi:hypothetical protein
MCWSVRLARALDLLNFSLADVRDGLGPYLSIYLLLTHHWDQASISVLQAITGIAGSVFAPALAAITLGVVGSRFFARRIGRNESLNHAGNASASAATAPRPTPGAANRSSWPAARC